MVFLNGRMVPADQAPVSVFDRGFLYGDGLFETMRVAHRRPFRWPLHWDRFQRGLRALRLSCPYSEAQILAALESLVESHGYPDAIARLAVSRGVGQRGYSPKGASSPTVVLTLAPFPEAQRTDPVGWKLMTSSLRLPPGNPLSAVKTSNKLLQVMARAEAEESGAEEALLLNTDGRIAEGTSGTLFWIRSGSLYTPPLSDGGLAGVSRLTLQDLAEGMQLPCREASITPAELHQADGVFLTLSTYGVAEAVELDGQVLHRSPATRLLWEAYQNRVRLETSSRS